MAGEPASIGRRAAASLMGMDVSAAAGLTFGDLDEVAEEAEAVGLAFLGMELGGEAPAHPPRLRTHAAARQFLGRGGHGDHVVVPLHPRTKKLLQTHDITTDFTTLDPVGYLDMIALTSNSYIVFTDSGGLQKEAFFFSKYCLTMRDQTEWIELVDGGFNSLVGADREKILDTYYGLDIDHINFNVNLYGDGRTAKCIVDGIMGSIGVR